MVSHHLDIRVIAATHADLEELVRNGSFRADLYYRLNILRVYTPSLKERKEDILYLANSFWRNIKNHWMICRIFYIRLFTLFLAGQYPRT